MKIVYLDKEKDYKLPKDVNLCLGTFDGVHIGHQHLFALASLKNSKVAVLTFSNSPKSLFNNREDNYLTPINKRLEILKRYDIDIVLVKDFNQDFANMTAEDFMNNFLINLNAKNLIVGFDYHFGKDALGTLNMLRKNFNVVESPKIEFDGKKVSTTSIILLLKDGNVREVNLLLNRSYEIDGKVVEGFKNGRTIGFPTANITPNENYLLPKDGVYIGLILINNVYYHTMINVGKHPTIEKLSSSIIECHILDYDKEIYGTNVTVLFLEKLRDEKKFADFNDLKEELEKNIKQTREYFKNI